MEELSQNNRIDLLAIDEEGAAVIIELKRGANKLQLLQTLSYAAMVSKWEGDRILEERKTLSGNSGEDVQNEIEEFLTEPMDHLNGTQRIILMAEGFDYEVMVAAEWLTETYDMDIRCYRLKLSAEADSKYLSCTCIYPPPEITDHSVKRGPKAYPPSITKWANWDKWNIFFP